MLLTASREAAADHVLPYVLLVFPLILVLWLGGREIVRFRARRRSRAAAAEQPAASAPPATEAESAPDPPPAPEPRPSAPVQPPPSHASWETDDEVDDAGPLPVAAVIALLSVIEDEGDGLFGEALGRRLGLRARIPRPDATRAEPVVYWGVRETRQVFLRLGVDERGEGGAPAPGLRRLECTVVRAALPSFRLRGQDGQIRGDGGPVPPPVQAVLDALAPVPDVWSRVQITAGPDGIVAVRAQPDEQDAGWLYDLWLLERLASVAHAEPLDAARIGPAWRVPYGLGRR